MRTIHEWLEEYGESHQNPINKMIHWVCVPFILLSLLGLLSSLSFPLDISFTLFDISVSLSWSIVLIAIATLFYVSLSFSLTIGMLLISSIALVINHYLSTMIDLELWKTSLIIFVLAWVGQFLGHKIEGKKPSFFQDIQFLLIGPAWLLSFIYNKLNIKI